MFGLKNRSKKKSAKSTTTGRRLVTVSESKSYISEQFRTIRANIKFSILDTDLKTILVTSATPGEGKSTNAANLGVVFAQEGKNVLIVDADMRKPALHYTFRISNGIGLSTVLSRQDTINNAIHGTPIVGLYILTSGPTPPNPAELLSSNRFDVFIEELKNSYDIIIFDTPPILSVSDAQLIAHKCDGTLLIIHSGVAEKEDVLKAQLILSTSQAKILGAVLNNYKLPHNREYYGIY